MKKLSPYLFTIALLVIVSVLSYDWFFAYSVSLLNTANIDIAVSSVDGIFNNVFWFSCSIGTTPILFAIAKGIGKIESKSKSFLLFISMIIGGFLMWTFTIISINSTIALMGNFSLPNVKNSFDINKINFGYFMIIGFALGALIPSIIMRFQENRKSK